MRFNNKIIVLVASVTLLGLIVSQFFVLKLNLDVQSEKKAILEQQIELEKNEFNNYVIISLTEVRDRLISFNQETEDIYLEPVKRINPNYYVVSFYDTLNKQILNNLITEKFTIYSITEEFKLGVYDCFTDSIIFDEYVGLSSTDSSKYVPQKWDHDGYYFGVYFPNRTETIIPEPNKIPYVLIFATLLIVAVVLFFGYTTTTLVRQKKISNITTDFINNMTHELKTPIATINLSVDVMAKSLVQADEPDERMGRYISIIKTENKRLEHQVERVLRIAKLEKGDIKLNFEELDIHEIIEGCIETFSVPIQERKGSLSCNLNANFFIINGDIIHITNIIYNLLDNANKYSEGAPIISIETQSSENEIKVLISDQGKGIPKEDVKFIFNKFYRVSTGDVHNVKGFGLGLYYVKQMIEKHGGNIQAKSKLGEGTVFTITLPLKR